MGLVLGVLRCLCSLVLNWRFYGCFGLRFVVVDFDWFVWCDCWVCGVGGCDCGLVLIGCGTTL